MHICTSDCIYARIGITLFIIYLNARIYICSEVVIPNEMNVSVAYICKLLIICLYQLEFKFLGISSFRFHIIHTSIHIFRH